MDEARRKFLEQEISMKPYGVKKNWNAVEDLCKNGHGESNKSHTATKKIYHRIARRTWNNPRWRS